jgi:hypothetical protein
LITEVTDYYPELLEDVDTLWHLWHWHTKRAQHLKSCYNYFVINQHHVSPWW